MSRSFSQKFWEDKHGRVVVWQKPNLWLSIWFATMVINWFLPNGWLIKALGWASLGSLIIWATLEASRGVNYFRRLIGMLVLLSIVLTRFF